MSDEMKDKIVGKAKEEYGRAVDDNETELKGKAQGAKGKAESKFSELKDQAAEKANSLIDEVQDKFNK